MSQGWKIILIVLGLIIALSTPLIWLLDDPGTGAVVSASVQAAVGVGSLLCALLIPGGTQHGTEDEAERTGTADAQDGGRAVTGIKRPQGRGKGSATSKDTGDGTATGDGSSAVTGIDYS